MLKLFYALRSFRPQFVSLYKAYLHTSKWSNPYRFRILMTATYLKQENVRDKKKAFHKNAYDIQIPSASVCK